MKWKPFFCNGLGFLVGSLISNGAESQKARLRATQNNSPYRIFIFSVQDLQNTARYLWSGVE